MSSRALSEPVRGARSVVGGGTVMGGARNRASHLSHSAGSRYAREGQSRRRRSFDTIFALAHATSSRRKLRRRMPMRSASPRHCRCTVARSRGHRRTLPSDTTTRDLSGWPANVRRPSRSTTRCSCASLRRHGSSSERSFASPCVTTTVPSEIWHPRSRCAQQPKLTSYGGRYADGMASSGQHGRSTSGRQLAGRPGQEIRELITIRAGADLLVAAPEGYSVGWWDASELAADNTGSRTSAGGGRYGIPRTTPEQHWHGAAPRIAKYDRYTAQAMASAPTWARRSVFRSRGSALVRDARQGGHGTGTHVG